MKLCVTMTVACLVSGIALSGRMRSPSILSTSGITETPYLSQQDETMIYEAVIRRLCGRDDTFGGLLNKPIIYIVRTAGDAIARSVQTGDAVVLSDTVQAGITAALAHLPSKVTWVDDFNQVDRDERTGEPVGGGIIILAGKIKLENNSKALVAGSIYVSNMAGHWTTYVVEEKGTA